MKKRVLAIIQARMSSTRLPGKVLKEVNHTPLLSYELFRLKNAQMIDKIVVATSVNPEDDVILKLCHSLGVECFRGSLDDVLLRYAECSKNYSEYQIVVRVTGDCPLIDPRVVDLVVSSFLDGEFDYVSNVPSGAETFPDGMDVEVFTHTALIEAADNAKLISEREHVTPYIRNNSKYRIGSVSTEINYSRYRLTVDTPEDFKVVSFLMQHSTLNAGYLDYITLLDTHPEIRGLNTHIARNEGMVKSLQKDAEIV